MFISFQISSYHRETLLIRSNHNWIQFRYDLSGQDHHNGCLLHLPFSVIIFVALFTFSFDSRHTLTFEEIYCGFVFIGIGVFGLYTLKRVSLTSLTPFMILNIFGCIFALITMVLACVRIFMLDRRHENYLMMKREDLLILPKLNCTKDVIGKCYLTMLEK